MSETEITIIEVKYDQPQQQTPHEPPTEGQLAPPEPQEVSQQDTPQDPQEELTPAEVSTSTEAVSPPGTPQPPAEPVVDTSITAWAWWFFSGGQFILEGAGNFFVALLGIHGDYEYIVQAAERMDQERQEKEMYPPNNWAVWFL